MNTEANRRLADVVKQRLDAEPLVSELGIDTSQVSVWAIRLLCPRGHFITNVAVIELRSDLVLLSPLDKDGQFDPDEPISDFIEIGLSRAPRGVAAGTIRQRGNNIGVYSRAEVALSCPREKCDRRRGRSYSGSFDYFGLAADIRSAAKAGHDEYQLTN